MSSKAPDSTAAVEDRPSAEPDEPWVADLPAADQVAYRKARLVWRQAEAANKAARRDAQVARVKPQTDFNDAKAKVDDAKTAIAGAIADADVKADALKSALDSADLKDSAKVADQMKKLQAAMDALTAAVAAVAKKQDELSAAQANLAKVSAPGDTTKPDPYAVQLAEDQYNLDVATADIAWQAAQDAFREAAAALETRKD